MMPECGCPMCDECARDSLINSEKNECPDCGEANNSPDDLIPWRQLRDKVINFSLEWKKGWFELIDNVSSNLIFYFAIPLIVGQQL